MITGIVGGVIGSLMGAKPPKAKKSMIKLENFHNYKATQAKILHLDDIHILFSYETAVALFDPHASNLYLCENTWGRTTARHMNIFKSNVDISSCSVQTVPQEILNEQIKKALYRNALAAAKTKITGKKEETYNVNYPC